MCFCAKYFLYFDCILYLEEKRLTYRFSFFCLQSSELQVHWQKTFKHWNPSVCFFFMLRLIKVWIFGNISKVNLSFNLKSLSELRKQEQIHWRFSCLAPPLFTNNLHYLQCISILSLPFFKISGSIPDKIWYKVAGISLMTFIDFDGTSTNSGKLAGLQRKFCNICPHSKYINCRNYHLALIFAHLIPKYEWLRKVGRSIMAV